MRICIVSTDKRYMKINELLLQKGYDSFISAYNDQIECDFLILPIREELAAEELKYLLEKLDDSTIVLCGNEVRVKEYFNGIAISYGKGEEFLLKNAYLTAEATISYIHGLTKSALRGKRVFVAGYGRIGRELCRILKSLGALPFAYARRAETVEIISDDGIVPSPIENCISCDIIINTVPAKIFSSELIKSIPQDVYIIELASFPYGFEDMERVSVASALPGRILENSGAEVLYDALLSIISSAGRD